MAAADDAIWLDVLPSFRDFGPSLAKGAGEAADKEGPKIGQRFGKAIVAGMGVVLASASVAGKALYDVGATFDDVTDTIRVGTGATGKNLDALVTSAKNVGRNVPASFDQIGSTVADLNTRMGLTGPTLEKVASQFLELGRITGQEIDITKTTAAFNAFGVKGEAVSGAMDRLYTISQATGIGINDLTQKTQAAAPAAQTLGFNFEQTAAMVGNLDKAGLNSSQTMASMSRAVVNLAKDGEQPQQAFKRVVGEIEGFVKSGNEAAALNLAGKVFGTRGAPQFLAAVKSGAIDLKNLGQVGGETGDSILEAGKDTADFAEQWQLFKNQTLLVVEPLATKLFSTLGEGMAWINDVGIPAIKNFVEEWRNYSGVGGDVRTKLDEAVGAIKSVTAAVWDNRTPIAVVSGLILSAFIPHWISLGVQSTISAAKQVAAWVTTKANAISSAAVHSAQIVRMVAGWALAGAKALLHGGQIVAQWVAQRVQAALSAAAQVAAHAQAGAAWLGARIQALASGAVIVAQWVAQRVQAGLAAAATVASFVAQKAAMLAHLVVVGLVQGATTAWTAAQWLLNVALNANPIALVIIALVALGVALVIAWQKSETFRNIVMGAWNGIKAAAEAVSNWFTTVVVPIFTSIGQRITHAFLVLKHNATALFIGLVTAVVDKFNWWRDTLTAIATAIKEWIVQRFTQLKDGATRVVQLLVDWVVDKFNWWRDTLAAIATAIKEWIVERFTQLKDGATRVVQLLVDWVVDKFTWWRDKLTELATLTKDWIVDRFTQLKAGTEDIVTKMVEGIGKIWDGLRDAASKPVRFVVDTVINDGILKGWNDLVGLLHLGEELKVAEISVPGFAQGTRNAPPGWAVVGEEGPELIRLKGGEEIKTAPETRRMIEAGMNGQWPVGAEGEIPGQPQDGSIATGSGIPDIPGLPGSLAAVIRGGPQDGDIGFGGPVDWGLLQQGMMGWYRRCLAFVNAAWGHSVPRFGLATARQSQNAGPRSMVGTPPPGAGVFWDTGGWAGHITLAVGDGTELSNDILVPGRIDRVPSRDFVTRWGAKYMGWWHPGGAAGGPGGPDMGGGFDPFAAIMGWIEDKLMKPVKGMLDKIPGVGGFVDVAKGMGSKLMDAAVEKIKSIGAIFEPGPGGAEGTLQNPGPNVARWAGAVERALAFTGIGSGPADVAKWLRQIWSESKGDPNLIQSSQLRDINVRRGDPARGLVQVPGVTWTDFGYGMGPFIPNVYDGYKNLVVGMRAASRQHRDWRRVIGYGHGYQRGTNNAAPGPAWVGEAGPELVWFGGGEKVADAKESARTASRGGNEYYFQPQVRETDSLGRLFEEFMWEVEHS